MLGLGVYLSLSTMRFPLLTSSGLTDETFYAAVWSALKLTHHIVYRLILMASHISN